MNESQEPKQVFLGGACGLTTWRTDIAIPLLEKAQVSYHNPQMPLGAWKEDDQYDEMRRKDECLVQLFVITTATRGVASVAEVAYLIGASKPVAIVLEDVKVDADIYGHKIDTVEADDLNRGRIFVRAMAERHNVPIFADIASGTNHCIALVKGLVSGLTLAKVNSILADIEFNGLTFTAEEAPDGFHMRLAGMHEDTYSGAPQLQAGRKWYVSRHCTPSDVVRTAFKAAATWAEHEARETFQYKNVRIFGPHLNIEALLKTTTLEDSPFTEEDKKAEERSRSCSV